MKVLIVSHNCFSSSQSMGKTLASLFSSFDKTELMQLYLYPSIPNVDVCGEYYRITDRDILSSILKRHSCGGVVEQRKINPDNTLFANEAEASQYAGINRNSFFIHRLRDVAWKLGSWKTKALKNWLKAGKPDVIFFALGDATFSQNIARWAARFLNIPLVTYVCDEFYFYLKKHPKRYYRLLSLPLTRGIKKTIKASKHVISICDSLGELYAKKFGTAYTTIMTGSSFKPTENTAEKDNGICFIGNTSLGRWRSLLDIADTVTELNKESENKTELLYYGKETEELKNHKGIKYGGYLTAEQVREVMDKSGFLIHVEGFSPEYKDRLMHSVSTKIADSLACGTCLFAYGPKEFASMQHLIRNNCAVVATSKEELKSVLKNALADAELRKTVIQKAKKTAEKYHDSKNNSEILKKTLKKAVDQ